MEPIIIAISGKSGCGNTTVSRLVAEALGLRFINYTFRALAAEKGLDLAEILEKADKDPAWDKLLDAKQIELARQGNCVIGSRLAMWLLPEATLKVYLKASQTARVNRIHQREGGDKDALARFTTERDLRDQKRYKEIYNLDTDNLSQAHLIIDTERWSPNQIAHIIVAAVGETGMTLSSR